MYQKEIRMIVILVKKNEANFKKAQIHASS